MSTKFWNCFRSVWFHSWIIIKSNKTFSEDAFLRTITGCTKANHKLRIRAHCENKAGHFCLNFSITMCCFLLFTDHFSFRNYLYYSTFHLNKVWFHLFLLSAAWLVRQTVVRKGWWADKKHSSSVLVAISQPLNTGHSDRLRLPTYYVSQRKGCQHYLKSRPLTTAHGKREGKWKTDKDPPK